MTRSIETSSIFVSDNEVIRVMCERGSRFVSHLAEAWVKGNDDERSRLRNAFPELWDTYKRIAQEQKLARRTVRSGR